MPLLTFKGPDGFDLFDFLSVASADGAIDALEATLVRLGRGMV
jgi:hypothetical protein